VGPLSRGVARLVQLGLEQGEPVPALLQARQQPLALPLQHGQVLARRGQGGCRLRRRTGVGLAAGLQRHGAEGQQEHEGEDEEHLGDGKAEDLAAAIGVRSIDSVVTSGNTPVAALACGGPTRIRSSREERLRGIRIDVYLCFSSQRGAEAAHMSCSG
jgi:hypothetical protein